MDKKDEPTYCKAEGPGPYLYQIAEFKSYHFVFVDESGCDGRVGYRRWGWSPKGKSPEIVTRFTRGKRWHILPAYTQDGILHSRVYRGKTDSRLFEDFIEQLLHFCGRYPEPRSVLVMDNASWHKSQKIRQMCQEAGVRVVFLSPYSPDFNPIEEYFGVLKRFIKKHWYRRVQVQRPPRSCQFVKAPRFVVWPRLIFSK